MDEVIGEHPLTFNGPLEAGVRAVAVLAAAYPRAFDVQRLTALDYLLTHTALLGGPDDLHPVAPIRTPATEVRRKLVQSALHLMMTRDLVCRQVTNDGIVYKAGDYAAPFLNALQSPYLVSLKERADWLMGHVGSYTNAELAAVMRGFFDEWVEEFQELEKSLGGDQ
jgi:hypothetical protein